MTVIYVLGGIVLIIAIAVVAVRARATLDRASQALLWLVLVQLASLRSPFTPDTYAAFPLVWMLVLWLARRGWTGCGRNCIGGIAKSRIQGSSGRSRRWTI